VKRYPYFPLYPADFASDGQVEAMTTEQVGAYWLLLCKAWGEDPVGSVPDDDRVLARWARLSPARWKRNKEAILRPWKLQSDGRWYQKRMRKEYARLAELSQQQSEKASKRWRSGSATAMPEQSPGNAVAIPKDMPEPCPLESDTDTESYTPPLPTGETPQGVKPVRKKFVPPQEDEVRGYWEARGLKGDPMEFLDYFRRNGWRTRSGPVVDWEAGARNWSRMEIKKQSGDRESRIMLNLGR
jgi:uncharacterized protein YdaU (DUF1376 family)